MATKVWAGNAHATRQIDEIDFGGTWATADTVTLTINTKDLIVTVGDDITVQNVAKAVRDAINAASRLDGTGSPDATSNFGGQEHGEFAELEAKIDPDDDTIVVITARTPGKPFTLTVAKSSTSGTESESTVQAATGPWHWNNADNWHSEAGTNTTVPATGDTVIFRNSNVPVLYGLPNGTLNIKIVQYQSYTGTIGLPDVNTDNAAKPYREYRQREVVLDDNSASDTTRTHVFGLGEGVGSPLIRIRCHNTATSPNALTTSAVVYNTGTPQIPGAKALRLLVNNEGSAGGTVTILKGSVDLGPHLNTRPVIATLNIAYTNSQPSDADVFIQEPAAAITINQNGGTLVFTEPGIESPTTARTFNISGGVCIVRDLATSGTVNATLLNSTFVYNATKTITTLIVGTGATFDAEKDHRSFTVTNCDLFEGAKLLDEYARGTYTNGIDLNRCGIDDVEIRVGNNRRLTLGSAA